MQKLPFIILSIFIALSLSSCQKEEPVKLPEDILGLGGDNYVKSDLDNWLYDSFVKNYNIEVKYKWDQFELDLNKMLVPIYEDKVTPVMTTVQKVWIDPYVELVGDVFIKKFAPKKYVLVGSPEYNNGTITLGQAEGGRKIVMFRLNWFKKDDIELIQSIMKTVHHEFAHTLHQTKMYPEEFMYITPESYTTSWTNVDDQEALALGFISPYSSASPDEDFVEMISRILVYGKANFDKRVESAQALWDDPATRTTLAYNPAEALRKKEAMVVNYMKQVWNIDMYDQSPTQPGLETLVQNAIKSIPEIL